MKWFTGAVLVMLLAAQPVWSGEPEFDPEQPFKGLGQRLLESVLGQALAALDDHFELSGSLDPDAPQKSDAKKSLRFKFYPNGKSKSEDHIAAEGWFGPQPTLVRRSFNLDFAFRNR